MRKGLILALTCLVGLAIAGQAQDTTDADQARQATGGAQTLDDIMARQRGEKIDDAFRRKNIGNRDAAADMNQQLGVLGGASDAELWRSLRYGSEDIVSSSRAPAADIIIQDGGMNWQLMRAGPLRTYGLYLLGGMLVLLAAFYLIRGRITIDGPKTGQRVLRFPPLERFAHWVLAGSFILLGVTGLITLVGRVAFIPLFGHEAFSVVAIICKWIHNNVSWAFMAALIAVFIFWVVHNLPTRTDIVWLLKGGGLFKRGLHPPARKFNAGQKIIFWSVIILGASISASGLSLLFPFELPMFAATFAKLNATGIPEMIGLGVLPETLAPHEEMQLAQIWHSIVGFVFMALIIAHIYIGSVGMEGAFDAMGSGEVEEQWAKEHHSLWYEEVKAKSASQTN